MRSSTLAGVLAGLVLVAGVGLFVWAPPPPAPSEGPNVLLIVWDTVRADRLSLYGHERPTTPRLDARAASGVVFERAVSPAMWTPPSHGSMFTGFAPQHHGVKATYKWLDAHHTTLSEHLGSHGWDTFLFSANPYVSPTTNLSQGFDTVWTTFTKPWKRSAKQATQGKLIPRDASTDISPAWRGKRVVGDVHPFKDAGPVAHEALVSWLGDRADPSRPWFAFINMMEAHIPRVPSLAARKALLDDNTLELGLRTEVSQMDLLAYTFGKKDYAQAEIDAIAGVYDAALRDLDDVTADLLEDLERRGALDNTIVLLTADHGENLGDHHMFGHKFSLWDPLIHVPLVVWWPDHLAPARVPTPVSNLALFATILDLVGLAPPAPGPDLTSSVFDVSRPDTLFSELIESTPVSIHRVDKDVGLEDKTRWLRTFRSAEAEGYKLIEASDGEQLLFHLPSDPGELSDLSATEPQRITTLSERIATREAAIPDYDPSGRAASDDPEHDIDRATQKMLEGLGYMEADEP